MRAGAIDFIWPLEFYISTFLVMNMMILTNSVNEKNDKSTVVYYSIMRIHDLNITYARAFFVCHRVSMLFFVTTYTLLHCNKNYEHHNVHDINTKQSNKQTTTVEHHKSTETIIIYHTIHYKRQQTYSTTTKKSHQ